MPATTKNKEALDRKNEPFESPELIKRYWDKYFQATSYDHERHGKEALDWFKKRISKDLNVKADSILNRPADYTAFDPNADRGMIGKLYLYKYEAEEAGDDDSGLYDQFPMCFFFNVSKNKQGKLVLWGLNMHYLTPTQRAVIYEKLMTLKASKRWSPKEKLKLQWELIKAATGDKLAEKAVHAYRVDRVKSRMVEIAANDWIVAVFLRLEKFLAPKTHTATHAPSDARKRVQNRNLLKPKPVRKRR